MPTLPDWAKYILFLGRIGQHPQIIRKRDPSRMENTFSCPKCGWEQTITDMDVNIEWTIPELCLTYKERWQGKILDDK